jgi:dTDP-4-amino-4,6-dideoxygalactose transaminase
VTPSAGRPRILLIGGTYRALFVLERLLERGERVVAFLGQEGSGDCDFCPEILEVCDRAGIPARSARKLGEEFVRWLDDRVRPDLAVSVGLRGEIPLAIGGNCRLGLLEVSTHHDRGPRPEIVLRHQGRELARRELDGVKEDERAGQLFVRLTEGVLELLDEHLRQIGRAHAHPKLRVPYDAPQRSSAGAGREPQPRIATEALESEVAAHLGAAQALLLSSAAAAASLLCSALGVGAGDEIVVPALASERLVRGLRRSGARLVYADVEPRTLTLDLASVRERLSGATRALVVSHALGCSAALDPLAELARDAKLALIEDCGAGFGACGPAGLLGAGPYPCVFELPARMHGETAAPALLVWTGASLHGLRAHAGDLRLPAGSAALARALRSGTRHSAIRARHAAHYDRHLQRYDAFLVRGVGADRGGNFIGYPLGVTRASRACAMDLHRLLQEVGIETRLLPHVASERELSCAPHAEQARESTLLLPIRAGLTLAMREAVLDALYDYAIG